jgi:CRP-like cAMP-binding protein
MFENLIKYFNSFSSKALLGDEIDSIQSFFVLKKFRKRQFLLQEGEICKHISFITRGTMRHYGVDEKGEDHIINLFIENWWVSDRESWLNETPSKYFIDAWDDTEVLQIKKDDIISLVESIPALVEWIKKLDATFAVSAQRRITTAISLSAEERYCDLKKAHPEFLQRFPQHIIASYLGINRETLSRIRSKAIKKAIAF